jgi:hypothetical protein
MIGDIGAPPRMGQRTTLLRKPRLVVAMLSLSALAGLAQQEPTVSQWAAAAASSLEKSEKEQPKSPPTLDQATYLRLRLQLAHGFAERPPCELDTPTGHADEIQRALKVFPEIAIDTDTFQAATQQLGLNKHENFSDDEKLLIYRQYENLTAIQLEPLGTNDVGQRTYALTFVPNHQPHCEPNVESQVKSASVTVDQQDRVSVGYLSMGVGPSSEPPRQTDSIPQSSPRIRIEKVTAPELRYRLLEEFGRVRLCECGPHCRGDETQREIKTFPEIQKDASTFRAIAAHLDLGGTKIISDEQKLAIYREYAQLRSVDLELLVTKYKFITVCNAFRTRGLIDPQGQITILNSRRALAAARSVSPAALE